MKQIVLASNNQHKLDELQQMLTHTDIIIIPQSEFSVSSVEETGLTFVENAIIKARHACRITGLPALADDSGLAVETLGGEPGIYSARYAGVGASAAACNEKLLAALEGVPESQRGAFFYCVIVLMTHPEDPTPIICQGKWQGQILTAPQGEQGFGYDPLFYVAEHDCSAAELNPAVKNALSHRGQALAKLLPALS